MAAKMSKGLLSEIVIHYSNGIKESFTRSFFSLKLKGNRGSIIEPDAINEGFHFRAFNGFEDYFEHHNVWKYYEGRHSGAIIDEEGVVPDGGFVCPRNHR